MWDLVGNPEDRFSQNEAQFITGRSNAVLPLWFFLLFVVGVSFALRQLSDCCLEKSCSLGLPYVLYIVDLLFQFFPILFLGQKFGSDCASSCSLLVLYFPVLKEKSGIACLLSNQRFAD